MIHSNKLLVAILLGVVCTSLSWAAPIAECGLNAQGGAVSTLAQYISTYGSSGCTVGDKVLSHFSYDATAGLPGSDQINVNPIVGPTGLELGFSFQGFWVLPVGAGSESFSLAFHASQIDGLATIAAVRAIGVAGFVPNEANNDALVDFVESICQGGDGCPGGESAIAFQLTQGHPDANITRTFEPTSTVQIEKVVTIFAPSVNSESEFGGLLTLKQTITQTPEPFSLALVGAGLVALGVMKRRSWKR